jgi:hypothetical protein
MERSEAHQLCNGPRTRALSAFIAELEDMFERAMTADSKDPNLELASGSRTAHTYVRKNFRALLKSMDYTMSYGCLSKSKYDIVQAKKADRLESLKLRRKQADLSPEQQAELDSLIEVAEKDLEVSKSIVSKEKIRDMRKKIEDEKKGTNLKRFPHKDQLKNI